MSYIVFFFFFHAWLLFITYNLRASEIKIVFGGICDWYYFSAELTGVHNTAFMTTFSNVSWSSKQKYIELFLCNFKYHAGFRNLKQF